MTADAVLASRLRNLRSSAIRDLLALTRRPEVVSLAGGIPDPALLPRARVAEAIDRVLADAQSLQYGETEGDPRLRELVAARHGCEPARVLITHGAQQALDILARGLLEPGSTVVVEAPSYLGALQIFALAEANVHGVDVDDDGMNIDALADALASGLRPALVYVVANFSNPSGATLSAVRRRQLAALADRYGFWIVEDDPYGALRYHGDPLDSIATYSERVIRLGTTSKVLAPGGRVGWLIAESSLVRHLVRIKQATDLHSSALSQALVVDLLGDDAWFDAHVETLRRAYGERAEVLVDAIEDHFGDRATVRRPAGGMFTWVSVPGVDVEARLPDAIEAGVAYVPGRAFFGDGRGGEQMRCSFATGSPDQLREAVRRLGSALLHDGPIR